MGRLSPKVSIQNCLTTKGTYRGRIDVHKRFGIRRQIVFVFVDGREIRHSLAAAVARVDVADGAKFDTISIVRDVNNADGIVPMAGVAPANHSRPGYLADSEQDNDGDDADDDGPVVIVGHCMMGAEMNPMLREGSWVEGQM